VFRPYRDRLVLAAHWGSANHPGIARCRERFDDVLARAGKGYAEVGMMTMVDEERDWHGWAQESIAQLQRYKERGRIGAIGMSGHNPATAMHAVRSGLIDVLMFPINMVGHGDEELAALYQACTDQGVGLVAMKVYNGGTLFTASGKPSGITPAHCLAYVLSLPVATTVPGPKNAEEMGATLHYLEASEAEKDYRPVVGNLRERLAGQCVYCHHCLPCPEGIEMGWLIWHVDQTLARSVEELKASYAGFPAKGSTCTACGVCLERCPFGVDIPAKMRRAAELFEAQV